MYNSHELKVIVYGMGNSLDESISYIKKRFEVIGFSDSDSSKANPVRQGGLPFILPSDISNQKFDYVLICSIYDDEIQSQLISDYGIPESRIWKRDSWCHAPVMCSFGERNPDKVFYVMGREIRIRNGLLSKVFSVLDQLDFVDKNGFIPIVDMQNNRNQYLEENKFGKENAWEYYFEQLSPYDLNEVYQSKNVVLGFDNPDYMYNYEEKYNIANMNKMYHKYIHIKPDVLRRINLLYQTIFPLNERVLGILYRGSDYNALKLKHHSVQPTIDEFIGLTKQYMNEWGFKYLYFCTEDADILEKLKAEFGNSLIYSDQQRFSNTGNNWLSDISFERSNDKYIRGEEYLSSIMLLTKCDALLSGICTASVFAHIVGGEHYEHVHIIKKGIY